MDDGARETTATGTHGGWGWLVAGLALGLFIIGAAALPALYGAYKLGLARGHERERLRALSHEEAIVSEALLPPEAPGAEGVPAGKRRGDRPGPRRPSTSGWLTKWRKPTSNPAPRVDPYISLATKAGMFRVA